LPEITYPDVLISYAEADNRDGGVAQFYLQLSQELQVQLGRPPGIVFQNAPRKALPAEELERATLLVAILTPSYLSSPGCRREIEAFLDKEIRHGRSDLIIPVHYVDTAFSTDPLLIRALTSHPLADWRNLRFESISKPTVRKELARIARDIRDRLLAPRARVIAPADRSWRIETLALKNFRCFEALKLDFREPSTLEGDWTCLAGINGAGKSSIVQAIGIGLLGGRARELGGGLLARMRRVGTAAEQSADITLRLADAYTGDEWETSVQIDEKGRLLSLPSSVSEELAAVAYGATRNLSNEPDARSRDESHEVQRMIGVFKPLAQLATAEALVSGWRKNPALRTLFSGLISEVFGRELAVSDTSEAVRFLVGEKDLVDALDLPDGFRSSAAWLADLCATWCETRPEQARSASHAEIDAIVLIDEIDLHLHPSLQRALVPRLRRALPKVQWIVTTHSPLVLANFDAGEIIALDRDEVGNVRQIDRQILSFTSNEIYDYLMKTQPTGAAMDEELKGMDTGSAAERGRIAELMQSDPDTNAAAARQRVEEFREILETVKRRA
jgi:predicted ATPase